MTQLIDIAREVNRYGCALPEEIEELEGRIEEIWAIWFQTVLFDDVVTDAILAEFKDALIVAQIA